MSSLTKAMAHASGGMNAQSFRIRIVSENISNADTHGYQRKLINFQTEHDRLNGVEKVAPGRVTLDKTQGGHLFDPSNPLADEEGLVLLSNVDLMTELADAKEAGRSYEANLSSFQQARTMYSSLIDILRR